MIRVENKADQDESLALASSAYAQTRSNALESAWSSGRVASMPRPLLPSQTPCSLAGPGSSSRAPTWSAKASLATSSADFPVARALLSNTRRIRGPSTAPGRIAFARIPYWTSKWGLVGFTKTLSLELGEYGIRFG